MKAKLISTPKVFEPFTVQVTFESREEALSMFARLNIAGSVLAAAPDDWSDRGIDSGQVCTALMSEGSRNLWRTLGQIVYQQITGITQA